MVYGIWYMVYVCILYMVYGVCGAISAPTVQMRSAHHPSVQQGKLLYAMPCMFCALVGILFFNSYLLGYMCLRNILEQGEVDVHCRYMV